MRSATEGRRRPGRGRELRDLLASENIRPRYRSGQNFLIDRRVEDCIVSLVRPGRDDRILEIGAGPGFLTGLLALRAREVIAVEIDSRLCGIMEKRLGGLENVRIVTSSILDVDMQALAAPGTLKVVGNLPYNITSPILFHILESAHAVETAVLMVQREVGERIRAGVGQDGYGALSVAVQWRAVVEECRPVSRSSFWPSPGVDSVVMRLRLRTQPPAQVSDETVFTAVVRAAFGKRRKRIANALAMSGSWDISRQGWDSLLGEAGIDGGCRAEEVSLEEFARLAEAVCEAGRSTRG